MSGGVELDSTDRAILDLLVQDARRSIADIAALVHLTPSPVKRRIDRLEQEGVITGYTALINHSMLGSSFEAFAEMRVAGNTNIAAIRDFARQTPEVVEVFTVAGDPDALARMRVSSVQHLGDVIDRLRQHGDVVGTKTLMVLSSWRRSS